MHWELVFSAAADIRLAQCDFDDAEEYRSNVRQRFNEVRSLDVEIGHDKGGLKIDGLIIDFDKIL